MGLIVRKCKSWTHAKSYKTSVGQSARRQQLMDHPNICKLRREQSRRMNVVESHGRLNANIWSVRLSISFWSYALLPHFWFYVKDLQMTYSNSSNINWFPYDVMKCVRKYARSFQLVLLWSEDAYYIVKCKSSQRNQWPAIFVKWRTENEASSAWTNNRFKILRNCKGILLKQDTNLWRLTISNKTSIDCVKLCSYYAC